MIDSFYFMLEKGVYLYCLCIGCYNLLEQFESKRLFWWDLVKHFVMDTIGVLKNCHLMLDFDWTLFCTTGLILRLNLSLSLFVFYFKQSGDSIFLNSRKRGSPILPLGSFLVGPGILSILPYCPFLLHIHGIHDCINQCFILLWLCGGFSCIYGGCKFITFAWLLQLQMILSHLSFLK